MYTKFLFHVLSFAHRWVIQTAQHLYTGGDTWSHFPQVSTESFKLAFRAGFFYLFSRVTLVGFPYMGDARSSPSISVQEEIVTPKIIAQACAPLSCPQSYELTIPRPKRGWVEVIMASHIF